MPDAALDSESLKRFLNDQTMPITGKPAATPGEGAAPALDQSSIRSYLNIPAGKEGKLDLTFAERNARPGIPFDQDIEVTSRLKTLLLMQEKPEDKLKTLEALVGKGNVRMAEGEPIVTVWDAKRGGPVEYRAMGNGPNIVPHAQALIPETIGALIGAELGGATLPAKAGRFMRFTSEMIGAGAGQEAAGAGKDIALSSTPLDQIIEERAGRIPKDVAANMLIGGAATAATKVSGKVISPFGGAKTDVEKGTQEARQYFIDKYGIDYPMTAGERISSPLFKRVEATLSREPGASSNFAEIQRKKVEALRQIQSKMLSSKLDPQAAGMLSKLEEDVGEEAINAIRQNVNPVVRAEETARNSSAAAMSDAIMEDLSQATGATRQLYPERVGAKLRRGAVAREDAFKQEAEALYTDAYAREGGVEKLLEPPSLSSDAKALLEKQPAPEVTTTEPTGLVGPGGEPLMRDVSGQPVLKEFVPEGVLPMLNRLANLDRAKFSLQDLVKMRTEVRNSIKRGAAIGNVKDHYLGEIEGMLTKAIQEGTDALPGGDLKAAWQKANQFYSEGAPKFKEKNIARLFKDKETGAFVQDEDLVRNIGPSEYQSYKAFFGESSPEFAALKRGIVDQLVPQGEGELVNAKQFLTNLRNFTQKNRSVAEDILGTEPSSKLHQLGTAGELLQKVQAGDVISMQDLNALAASGKMRAQTELTNLIAKQRELTDVYRSQIVKDIAEGRLGQTFNASEFVSRLWDTASPKEVAAVKKQLEGHPEILEDLQRKAAERVFQQAQKASATEPARLAAGEPYRKPSASSVEAVFGSEQNKAKLTELIGNDRMGDFEQLAKLLRGGEAAETAFAGAGGFSAQMQIHRMMRGGVFSYLADWLKQKVAASFYFSKATEKLLSNQVGRDPALQANVARAAVLSQPFMTAMGEDFGDKASMVIDKILDSIDLYEKQGPPGAAKVGRQSWVDQAIRQAGQPKVFPAPTNAPAVKGP